MVPPLLPLLQKTSSLAGTYRLHNCIIISRIIAVHHPDASCREKLLLIIPDTVTGNSSERKKYSCRTGVREGNQKKVLLVIDAWHPPAKEIVQWKNDKDPAITSQ